MASTGWTARTAITDPGAGRSEGQISLAVRCPAFAGLVRHREPQRLGPRPRLVDRDGNRHRPRVAQHLARRRMPGALDREGIARIEDQPRAKIQSLPRAVGDDDLAGLTDQCARQRWPCSAVRSRGVPRGPAWLRRSGCRGRGVDMARFQGGRGKTVGGHVAIADIGQQPASGMAGGTGGCARSRPTAGPAGVSRIGAR